MAFPANLDTIVVRHKITDAAGRPLKGNTVTAVPAERVWATDGSIVQYRASTQIDANGQWELELPYVDQEGIRNKGVPWRVTEHVPGQPKSYFVAPVLAHGAGPIDVAECLVSAPASRETVIQAGPVTDEAAASLLAQDGEFATRLKVTIGAEVGAQVPAKVAEAIADDDTVVQAASVAAESAVTSELVNGQAADTFAPVDAPLAPRHRFMAGLDPRATRLLFLPHTGHGWTLNGGGDGSTIGLDPNRRGPFTAESLHINRPAGTSNVFANRSGLPPVDLNDGPLVVWLHLPDPVPAGVYVRIGQNSTNCWHWNINGAQDPDRAGHHLDGWTAFELFPERATQVGTPTRDNNTYAQVALIGTGQEAWIGGIGQRLLPRTPNDTLAYPNGVLTLFFDDGYESQYTHALPVLARHGFPGVLGTIVSYVNTPGFMTTNQLRQLQDNAGWEIAAHSYSPNGPEYRFDQFTPTELEREFRRMKTWLVSNGFDSDTWVSPGGVFSRTIWETGRRYFTLHRGVSGAGSGPGVDAGAYQASPRRAYPSIITPNFGTDTNTLTNLKAVVDGVKTAKSWGSMAFHQVTDQGPSSGQVISVADLTELTDYIAAQGVPVRTVKQIMADVN